MQTMAEQMQNILWGRERTTSSPHFSSGIVERAKCERAWKSPHAILDPNAYGFGNAWARLEFTEPLSVHICLVRREHELYWTHNFFILDKGCPILTWRWCFLQSRQTVRYPQKSGSHLALISRCSSILAIGGFYHTVEKVSRVHSTGKSLDRLSTTIWARVG